MKANDDSNSTSTLGCIPQPSIDRSKIATIGGCLFALALIFPPAILILTAILAVIVPYSFRDNDTGEQRRRLWAEFLKKDGLPEELQCKDVELEERYWVNDRGMALLTSTMVPKNNAPIRAVICFCHGYMDNSSFLKRIQYQRLVMKGIAVVMIEYEGHGRSDGPNVLIPCWENLIGDAHKYFQQIATEKFPGKKVFLMGESMGGAVAYDLITHHRKDYAGAIFVAPMLKISIAPPDWVVALFYKIVGDPGTVSPLTIMPFAPSKGDIPDLSFKDKKKMALALSAPTKYGRKPRLASAREMLDATKRIGETLGQFDAPFIVMHGLGDFVTCPEISESLYKESTSTDKEIKLYKGFCHNLTAGETDENIDTVFNDAIAWVTKRTDNPVVEQSKNPVENFLDSVFKSPQKQK